MQYVNNFVQIQVTDSISYNDNYFVKSSLQSN